MIYDMIYDVMWYLIYAHTKQNIWTSLGSYVNASLYCYPGHISDHAWNTMQWGLKIPIYDVLVECQIPSNDFIIFFTVAQQPLVSQGLPGC